MSREKALRIEPRERLWLVWLEHGANALDSVLLGALEGLLTRAHAEGCPPLVLASSHRSVFCPGLDLRALDGMPREAFREEMRRLNRLLRTLACYPGPTVAAIGGHAIAGGCLVALACDRRVMARARARLGLSEVNLGVPVPAGSVAMLLALYPTRAVEQLVLEGDGFGGERALELGLIERLADPDTVIEDACRLAALLAARPQGAFATAKSYLRNGLGAIMEERDERELDRFLDHWYEPATQDRIAATIAGMTR